MSEKKEPGGLYTAGYHGTSVEHAMRIAQSGYDATEGAVVFLPEYNLRGAIHQGVKESVGMPEFAIVFARFPATALTEGVEHAELVIPHDLLGGITIVRAMAWQMRRNAGIPPRPLYDREPYSPPVWWTN